jgi:hypothetical protein
MDKKAKNAKTDAAKLLILDEACLAKVMGGADAGDVETDQASGKRQWKPLRQPEWG